MLLSYGYRQQQIGNNKTCRRITGNFDCHMDAAVQRRLHHPLEHGHGFTRSHWMPLLSECLCPIAPVAVTVDKFVESTQTLTKHNCYLATTVHFER
jgi:hypothetical protein